MWCSRRRVASLSPVFVGDWGRGRFAGCFAALAMLVAVVTKGDAYLSSPPRRVPWWGSLAEQKGAKVWRREWNNWKPEGRNWFEC